MTTDPTPPAGSADTPRPQVRPQRTTRAGPATQAGPTPQNESATQTGIAGATRAAGAGPAPGQLGRTLPSWQLRGWLALSCLIVVGSIAAWAGLHLFMVAVLLASAAYAAMRPDSHAPTAFLALAAGVVVFSGADLSAWILPAVLGFHASHVLAAFAALAPWDAAVEYVALRPALRRFVVVQAASQFLALLALLVAG